MADRSFTGHLPELNPRNSRCRPCPPLSEFACLVRGNSLAPPKAEEAMTVPVRSGHRLGDLGQVAEGLAIPGEAVVQDHDPLELAIPLSHQQRAGLQAEAVSGLRRPTVEGSGALVLPIGAKHPLNRPVDTAEGFGLQAIGQHPYQQPALEMGRRLAAQMNAPLAA